MSSRARFINQRPDQRGAILVMMVILLVVLIGMTALALDVGRLMVLRTEMQNAADAAALAGAVELDGQGGARARAEAAARSLLQHQAHFARQTDLLNEGATIEFFCAINAKYDPADLNGVCHNGYGADGKSPATTDAETHYIRVTLGDGSSENPRYSVELYFLPVLSSLTGGGTRHAGTRAFAVAGRTFYMCRYPPMMICNPFEPDGQTFKEAMRPGEQIQLKQQGGNTWTPGNFAFLQPDTKSGGGAPDIALYLADEGRTGCTPPIVTTKTGGMTNKTAMAINTRFDVYGPPAPFASGNAPALWPPAPNVIDYPRDQTWRGTDARFGNGDWDRTDYWNTFHAWQGHIQPTGYSGMSRWQVYNWEISNSQLPSKNPLKDTDDPTYDGIPNHPLNTGNYPPPRSIPDRRMMHIGVLNCMAYGITGTKTVVIQQPNGFAKIFIAEHVASPPDATIFGEYIGWSDETDPAYHVDVQLYE